MVKRREVFTAVLGLLALAGMVRADMTPVSPAAAPHQPLPAAGVASAATAVNLSHLFDWPGVAGLDLPPAESWPALPGGAAAPADRQSVSVLTEGQNSFSLCLYALLGLGLYKSAPLVKKLSFGCVPPWYHDGGPFQVGHSLAISPDCLGSAPVCFVQPVDPAEAHVPRYHFATVVSLWRTSPFTPAVLASRAPPAFAR